MADVSDISIGTIVGYKDHAYRVLSIKKRFGSTGYRLEVSGGPEGFLYPEDVELLPLDSPAAKRARFRFVGFNPSDWTDELRFDFELRFDRPLTDAERVALAPGFREAFPSLGNIRWCGPFAQLQIELDEDARELLDRVSTYICSLPKEPILMEALFLNSADEFPDDLEPGPAWRDSAIRVVDPALPEPMSDTAFDKIVAPWRFRDS